MGDVGRLVKFVNKIIVGIELFISISCYIFCLGTAFVPDI